MEYGSQIALLRVAREAISEAAAVGPGGTFSKPKSISSLPSDPELHRARAAFVTIHKQDGAVRGCVGTTVALRPLVEVVSDMARAAALRDPRFQPVVPDEVAALVVEISVLHPPALVEKLDHVRIGRDGLLVVGRGCRGVLLPQVAEERGWDAATFAENTCRKAGLEAKAYEGDDVELYWFEAEVFSERDGAAIRNAPSGLGSHAP